MKNVHIITSLRSAILTVRVVPQSYLEIVLTALLIAALRGDIKDLWCGLVGVFFHIVIISVFSKATTQPVDSFAALSSFLWKYRC